MSEQRQPTHEEMVEGIAKGIHDTLVNRGDYGEPPRRAFKEAIEEGIAIGLQRLFDGRIPTLTDAVRDGSAAGFVELFRGRILSLIESVQAGVAKALGSALARGFTKEEAK